MYEAFPLAEKYRTIVIVAADGSLGQMMEPAEMPPMRPPLTEAERGDWAVRGASGPAQAASSPRCSSTKPSWRR